ncbi:MAG TPA: hypothetical protein VGW58_17410 [Pyrinomonadaceae bacterium]|nr:hypothetical protein [Pyrinomonadaceae bacterium]
MPKRFSTPTDENRLAKWIVDQVTIEAEAQPEKNPVAGALGRMGGKTKAAKPTPAKRKAIARKAAKARWRS